MGKTKKILGFLLLSIIGASSVIVYGVVAAKKQLQDDGYTEEEAENRLLEMRNEEIAREKENVKNSRNLLQKIKTMFSLAFLQSEKNLLD